LIGDGTARVLANRLESWNYAVGDEMGALAEEVTNRLRG